MMSEVANRSHSTTGFKRTITLAVLVWILLVFLPFAGAEEKEGAEPDLPKDALKALYFAQQAINEKNYAEAINKLNEYLGTGPVDVPPVVYMMLGNCYYQSGEREKARNVFGGGHKVFPKDADILLNYGVLTYESGRFSEAATLFEKLYRLKNESDKKILFQAAVAYYQAQERRQAKRVLAELLDARGDHGPKWHELMIALCVELEDWQEAERRIDNFLSQVPAQAKYWRLLAQMRLEKEQYQSAAAALEIAYRLEPPKSKEWLDLADLYLYLNAPLMAIRCMEAGYGGNIPADALIKIAETYARTQRFDQAVKHIEKAFTKNPSASVLFEKGQTLYNALRYQEAISVLEQCVRMDPKCSKCGDALMLIAFAAWNLKDWEKARTAFSDASRLPKYRENALDGVAVLDDLIATISEAEESDE